MRKKIAPPCPLCLEKASRLFLQEGERRYFECPRCRVLFLHPDDRLDPHAERSRYELHENHPDDPGYRTFLMRLAKPLLPRLDPEAEGLDYGCGPAPVMAMILREAGHPMQSYDPFFAPDPCLLVKRYDFITCSEAAEHFYDPAAEFGKLASRLLPGGILALMTSLYRDEIDFTAWYYRKDPTHVIFYRKASFTFLAKILGMRCEFPAENIILMQKL